MQQIAPKVEELFFAALELESPDARLAFLDGNCGDTELRRQVEELLACDARSSDFLEAPASMPTVTAAHEARPGAEEPGTVVGPYKLMEAIGEGGMGVVYVAEQHEPVRRKVALKLIKPGMDSRQVVARFEAERQALAMMDHPNIARVLDAGTAPSGRPYFVMELVRGLPITEYCDRHELSIPERLELFTLVCRAVQHAHQKGVIHRDLKPSNVLVTEIDGVAVPKVIDFGVAKATGQALTDRTLYTGFHQFVGTPLYTSPEQAELSGANVDTRSDIYSLGVLLYELLTGTTPFDSESLKKAAFDEMRRIIREEEPPKPSTRLSSLGDRLSTVSARRKADPKRLGLSIQGELDWVVMKALEKDRRRRYETAGDFAADVMNYLTDRPVEAFPPSAWYRFAKFARRNRVALAIGAVAGSALVLGVIGLAAAYLAISRAYRAEAEQRQLARQAVDQMYTEVAEKWLAREPELTPLQREFLEKALAFYRRFAEDRATDPQARADVARALERVAAIRAALGQHEEAEAATREAVSEYERLAAEHPEEPYYRGRLAEALGDLGNQLMTLGRTKDAEAAFKRAIATDEELIAKADEEDREHHRLHSFRNRMNLAILFDHTGRYQDAEGIHRKLRDTLETLLNADPGDAELRGRLAEVETSLAVALGAQGRAEESQASRRRALELREKLLEGDPANPEQRDHMAASLLNVGNGLGGTTETLDYYRRAIEVWDRLVTECPDRAQYRERLVVGRTSAAITLLKLRRYEELVEVIRPAIAPAEKLADDFPKVPAYRQRLAKALSVLSAALLNMRRYADAEEPTVRAREVLERLVADHPDIPEYRRDLGEHVPMMYRVADSLSTDPAKGKRDYERALALARRAVELRPDDEMALQSLGAALYRSGNWKGSVETLMKSMKGDPKKGDSFQWFFLAMDYWQLGDPAEARRWFDRAEEHRKWYEEHWNPGTYPVPAMHRRIRDEAAVLLGMRRPDEGATSKPEPDSN